MFTANAVVSVILLVLSSLGNSQANITVASSSAFLSVWHIVTSSFNQIIPTANIPLTIYPTYDALDALNTGAATVILSEMSMSDTIIANTDPTQKFPAASSVPLLFQAYNVIYNVPDLPMSYHIVLNAQSLSGIFLNQITRWNDPVLVALNPSLANVTAEIRFVHRNTESGTTNVFTRALSTLSPEWGQRYGPVSIWPPELITNNSIICNSGHVFAVSGYVQANPYSLGFIAMSYYVESIGSLSNGLNYAHFLSEDNGIIMPNATNIKNAVSSIKWSKRGNVTGLMYDVNSKIPAWPIIGMGYIIVNNTIDVSKCKDQKSILKFFNWFFTSGPSSSILEANGYYFPPPNILEVILQEINSIDCNNNGVYLLAPTTSFASRFGQIVVVCLFPLLIIGGIILSVIYNRKTRIATVYSVALILALCFNQISMVLWVVEPVTSGICNSRWWFLGIGLSLVSGSVYARSYQLKKIHQLIKDGLYKSAKRFDHANLTAIVLISVNVSVLILLLVLQFVVPFSSQIVVLDPIRRTGEFQCVSQSLVTWIGALTVYLSLILFLGIYAMYSTWTISSTVDDTRINILMIFVCVVVLVIADNVLLGTSSARTDSDQSWWAIIIQSLWGLAISCSVFLPKFVKSYYKSSSNHSGETKTTSTTITRKIAVDSKSDNNNSNVNGDCQSPRPDDKQPPKKKKIIQKKGDIEVIITVSN